MNAPEMVDCVLENPAATLAPGIWEDFSRLLDEDPLATAVLDDRGSSLTRQELDMRSEQLALQLQKHGLRAGDAVIICMPNWTEWMVIYLAALRSGLVPGTLPVTSDPGSIGYVVSLVGAKALFLPGSYRGRNFEEETGLLAKSVEHSLKVIFSDGNASPSKWNLLAGRELEAPEYPRGIAHILFSSATTGRSKAIAHSEASLRAYNLGVIERYGVDDQQAIFMPSPLGHSTGFWHGARMSLMTGASLVLQDRWNPRVALELVAKHRCAITVAATPFLTDLVDEPWDGPEHKLQGMRVFLCGGAPIPPSLIRKGQEQMPDTRICAIWAMSEGGATSNLMSDSVQRVAATCGKALNDAELVVLDNTGKLLASGEGEIAMKTPSLFLGYINQPDLYHASFTPEGFFRTGDLGLIDEQGYLRITGRSKDLIIRGGVNISPVEIESALVAHPEISRIAVIGSPDDRMGERICAVIEASSAAPTLSELQDWLAHQQVPRRLWPESVQVVDQLPQTPAGKIRKNVLRQQLFGHR